ncbi:MAG: hypothetical protein ACYCX2_01375 [Christensenellales bacterium]
MTDQKSNIEDLIADLMYLRKGLGFVANRVYEASTFLSVIGGRHQIFENIKIRFISAVRSLPDKQNVEALLVAYALLPGYETITLLRDRRAEYGKQVKRKYDTLSDRELAAIKELAIRLLTAYYSGAPLPTELPLPHGGFLMDSLSIVTVIQDRRFVEHQQTRRVISLVQGARGFEYQSNDHTWVIPLDGVDVETRHIKNGAIHKLLFPKPLKRGQSYAFSFKEILDEPEPELDEDFAGQSFETPTLTYKQAVVFKGDKPPVIWLYDKLSRIVRPGEPTEENRLEIYEDGIAVKEFIQLYGGLHSGIAWRWK